MLSNSHYDILLMEPIGKDVSKRSYVVFVEFLGSDKMEDDIRQAFIGMFNPLDIKNTMHVWDLAYLI